MKRFYRIAGKLIGYMCLTALLFIICCIDGVPEERLDLVIMVMIAMAGGCAAGVYIWSLGERR